MVLTFGTAPTSIGPGMRLFVLGVLGPVPNDDFLTVSLFRTIDGESFTYGTKLAPVAGTNLVTLGYDGRLGKIVEGEVGGMAEGTAMSVTATQYHADGTEADSSADTPYGTLDTHSYPWALFGLLVSTPGGGTGKLDLILAAVRVEKTTPGQV